MWTKFKSFFKNLIYYVFSLKSLHPEERSAVLDIFFLFLLIGYLISSTITGFYCFSVLGDDEYLIENTFLEAGALVAVVRTNFVVNYLKRHKLEYKLNSDTRLVFTKNFKKHPKPGSAFDCLENHPDKFKFVKGGYDLTKLKLYWTILTDPRFLKYLLVKHGYIANFQPYCLSALLHQIMFDPLAAYDYLYEYYHGKEYKYIFTKKHLWFPLRIMQRADQHNDNTDILLSNAHFPSIEFPVFWEDFDDETVLELYFVLEYGTIQPLETYLKEDDVKGIIFLLWKP